MPSPRYPLECVVQVHDGKVEKAKRDVAAAVGARRAADGARITAEERRDRHEALVGRVRVAELDALARGELRAGDLQRARQWALGVAAESARLRAEAERAQGEALRAGAVEERARAHLTARKVDAEATARNRARWQHARRAKVEAREEEASLEAWRPKK
ncbi:MAG TPA: hypothetical protein VEK07_20405 [Polyangiaceae bacterium]|nr:hypothetical protein [Polyangiaceae bacterium]